MQAIDSENTAGNRKGDAKGQFGYGSVVEEGNTTENPHEPDQQPWIKRNKRTVGAVVGLGLVGTVIALLLIFRPQEATAEEQFKEYTTRFKKEYADDDEFQARFEAFKLNLIEIAALKKLDGGASFGWNIFTDMTQGEFATKYLGREGSATESTGVKTSNNLRDSPSSTGVDWTAEGVVPPVRDQGSCGSCWAYSTVATIETRYIMDQVGTDNEMSSSDVEDFELSVQQMVSCDSDGWNGGCNGGDPPGAFDWVADNGGLAHYDDYPYTSGSSGSTGSCNDIDDVVSGTNIDAWYYATPECYDSCSDQDEDTMAASVEDYGPITVCVNANRWQYYTGGIMTASQCGSSRYWALNHCVQLTGFDISASDSDEHYWILRNSWDTSWGDDGYMFVSWGENTCGIADEAIYVTLKE